MSHRFVAESGTEHHEKHSAGKENNRNVRPTPIGAGVRTVAVSVADEFERKRRIFFAVAETLDKPAA